jgi:hypothetical protein
MRILYTIVDIDFPEAAGGSEYKNLELKYPKKIE